IAGKGDELDFILIATHALVDRMRHHLVYAELQNAVGRIYSSAGINLAPDGVEGNQISDMVLALEKSMYQVETGLKEEQILE
ncbi:MAG: hypothetical protein GY860_20905, partial [Desulfobacteraceae bacterium]|nr:hypothetical protein [Desulfobacteraceae bacterium]